MVVEIIFVAILALSATSEAKEPDRLNNTQYVVVERVDGKIKLVGVDAGSNTIVIEGKPAKQKPLGWGGASRL